MANFYKRVNDRIKALMSFDETIARINELNDLILEALKERSKYPVCRNFFDISLRRKEQGNPQRDLESKGIDTVGWNLTYSRIVEKICPEGDYVEGILEAEAELEELVHERIFIGENVIKYKSPRGMAITRKEREEGIINYARNYASENDMNPDAVEDIFRFLMEQNKEVQLMLTSRGSADEKLREVKSCRTMVKDLIDSIKGRFEFDAEMLRQKNPGVTYRIVVEEELKKSDPLPYYVVKLVQE